MFTDKPVTKRKVAVACLAVMTPLLTGCFGTFPVTSLVYDVNDSVSDSFSGNTLGKVAESVVMWIFAILPVYGLAILGDVIIFNLIEFWTGDPIRISSTTLEDGTIVTLAPTEDENVAIMTLEKDGMITSRNQIIRVSDKVCEIRSEEGIIAGRMEEGPNGGLLLLDASGEVVDSVGKDELTRLASLAPQT